MRRFVSSCSDIVRHALVVSAVSLPLIACGPAGPGDSNDFGNSDRGNSDPEANVVSVAVTVEATLRMLNEAVQVDSDNIVVADNINCSAITIEQLNFDFSERGGAPDLPDATALKRSSLSKPNAPGCKIEFTESFDPRVDAVIKVEYPNGEFLYAPLRRAESDDQSVAVSFGSHLAVKKLFEQFTDSVDLAKALPCSSGSADCETQHKAKARLLSFISETARLYEYTDGVVATDTAAQALAKLEAKSDLSAHINTAVSEITRATSPIAKGTLREDYDPDQDSSILDGALQSRLQPTENYNSVFFALGFSAIKSPSQSNLVTSTSHISANTDRDPNPRLIHNAYYLDYRYDDILPDIPTESSSMNLQTYNFDPTLPENRYSFLTNVSQSDTNQSLVNGTHLSNQGFFLNDRAINQALTDTPTGVGDRGEGYDFNPVYYKLYRVNEYEPDTSLTNFDPAETPDYGDSATWYTGSGYGLANVYEIEQTSATPLTYERISDKETQTYFSWETHGLEADPSISKAEINGKLYDVINFYVDMQQTPTNPITVRAETLVWDAQSDRFFEQQGASHYRTWELARTATNTVSSSTEAVRGDLTNLSYSFVETDSQRNGLVYLGGTTRSRNPLGHVSASGDHLAFAIDESSNTVAKRGIILANKQRSGTPNLSAGPALEFTLSGNYVYMDNDKHRLASLNESTLTMRVDPNNIQDCLSDLTISRTYLDHMLTGTEPQKILAPVSETLASVASSSCSLNGGRVQLDFTVDGNPLILRGFATPISTGTTPEIKLMNLLWLQDDALGLVFAQADQNLSVTFDN
jgi:hypothetical protein